MILRSLKLLKYLLRFVYYKSFIKSDQYYDVVYNGVSDLGGLYVKAVQFICLRTEVFSRDQKARFLSFYDNVGVKPLDLKSILLLELGSEKLQSFSAICDTPFASGSFAQVYHGKLLNGKDVIIKVKRKNIAIQLTFDFWVLKFIGFLFNLFYYQKMVNVRSLISEFEDTTFKELDYKKEVENGIYFYNKYIDHPSVVIPYTYSLLSTDNIIVQDYVDGISLADLIRVKFKDEKEYLRLLLFYQADMKVILTSIAYEHLLQGFLFNRVYADPHPGNIKILPKNKFALIDFGISGEPPENKRNYYQILEILANNSDGLDTKRLGKEFLEFGATRFFHSLLVFDYYFSKDTGFHDHVIENYTNILERNKDRFSQLETEKGEDFTDIFVNVIKLGEKFNIMLPSKLFSFIRSAVIVKSYNEFLEPDFHFMRQVYKNVLSKVNRTSLTNMGTLKDFQVPLEESIETVFNFLTQIAEKDMPLYLKLNHLLKRNSYV